MVSYNFTISLRSEVFEKLKEIVTDVEGKELENYGISRAIALCISKAYAHQKAIAVNEI